MHYERMGCSHTVYPIDRDIYGRLYCARCGETMPEPELTHKSQEDLMQEHDVCEKVRTCVRGYKHDGYHVNKHGFVLGATIG